MASDDIQGTVVDSSGTAVEGAVVEVTPATTDASLSEKDVVRTTTDSNGKYIVEKHPAGDGTSQEWHVSAYNWDGSTWYNALNKPGVTASLAPAIPDSVVAQYRHESGSGTTLLDNIGNNDGTITGAAWESDSDAVEGFELSYDGTDDDSVIPGDSSNTFGGARTVGGTFTFDDLSNYQLLITKGSETTTDLFDYILEYDGSSVRFRVSDGSNNLITVSHTPSFSTGVKKRIFATWDGTTTTDGAAIVVDGGVVATDTASATDALATSSRDVNIAVRATQSDLRFSGDMDNIIFANERWSSQEFSDDYNRQPWS